MEAVMALLSIALTTLVVIIIAEIAMSVKLRKLRKCLEYSTIYQEHLLQRIKEKLDYLYSEIRTLNHKLKDK